MLKGSYAGSVSDGVDMFSGKLEQVFPLISVQGRGEANLGLYLPVRNTEWKIVETGSSCPQGCQQTYRYHQPQQPNNLDAFVRGGYGSAGTIQAETKFVGWAFGNPQSVTVLKFTSNNGSIINLHDELTNGEPYLDNPRGCVLPPTAYPPPPPPTCSRGSVFRATDGTNITFVADNDVYDIITQDPGSGAPGSGLQSLPGTLYLSNGTRIRFDASNTPATITDRNGNYLNIEYGSNGTVSKITDSLNREVSIVYGDREQTSYYDEIVYQGFGGVERRIRITYRDISQALAPGQQLLNTAQLFPHIGTTCNNNSSGEPCSVPVNPPQLAIQPVKVVSSVRLPNSKEYQFFYNSYLDLARISYPTGEVTEYEYSGITGAYPNGHLDAANGSNGKIYRRVSKIKTLDGSGQLIREKLYDRIAESNGMPVTVATSGSGGSLLATSRHYFYNTALNQEIYNFLPWSYGKEYKSEALDSAQSILRTYESDWTQAEPFPWCATPLNIYSVYSCDNINFPLSAPAVNPRVKETKTTLETGQVAKQTFNYNQYNNVTDTYEYGYGAGAPTAYPLRHTHTDYEYSTAYTAAPVHLRGLATASQIYAVNPASGAETLAAQSETRYDEQSYPNNYGTVTGWSDPGVHTKRGNPTTTRRWLDYNPLNPSQHWLETHAGYDQLGHMVTTTDALGRQATVSYADSFQDKEERGAFAFPTRTTTPVPDATRVAGSDTPFESTTKYDYWTGLVTSVTDAQGNTSNNEYEDTLDRLTKSVAPDGGVTEYSYNDTVGQLYVETRTTQNDNTILKTRTYADALGRSVRTFSYEGRIEATPWLANDTYYDALGRVVKASQTYRVSEANLGPTLPANCVDCAVTNYDILSRAVSVVAPDGATATTNYNGNTVTVSDAKGQQKQSVTDALGRLTQVTEAPDDANFNYTTNYAYDILGNLRQVTQGTQTRYFMYDSLSRLIRARNPEQDANGNLALTDPLTTNSAWSFAYEYDNNGNLQKRTDARGVLTEFFYDALNRNRRVTYSDSTPEVKRYYDSFRDGNDYALPNGKGKLWQTETANRAVVTMDNTDVMGRPKSLKQRFWNGTAWSAEYAMSRVYDLAGHVTEETYPSGHTVTNSFDALGRLQNFSGNLGDGVIRSYADMSAPESYNAKGQLQQERYGTLTPLYHKMRYNVRNQIQDMRLSSVPWPAAAPADPDAGDRGAIANYYDEAAGQQPLVTGPQNNGNLRFQDIKLPDGAYFRQRFEYDKLNRLTVMGEQLNGAGAATCQQTFLYDRYGNRSLSNNPAQSWNAPVPQFTVHEATNRLTPAGDCVMQYDAAGNLINDTCSGAGLRQYDAENRITQAQGQTGNVILPYNYRYDGDGRRISRFASQVAEGSPNPEIWQVYGFGGELLAEYAANAVTILPQKEYGYEGGKLLITASSGDNQRLRRFVENLYLRTWGYLQSGKTQADVNSLVTALGNAGQNNYAAMLQTAKDQADALFNSAEYANRNTTNEQYIADLYLAYLQRPPESSAMIDWWAAPLYSGMSRAQRRLDFRNGAEFAAIVTSLWGAEGQDYGRVDRFLNNIYQAATGSLPGGNRYLAEHARFDTAEVSGMGAVKDAGKALGRYLLGSDPADNSAHDANGNPLPAYRADLLTPEYVRRLYETFLRRAPDANAGSWETQANASRHNVLEAFLAMSAYQEQAGALYREIYWLVSDHLGTPRMIAERTGSLAGIKRHDSLPFGEEMTLNRAPAQGYVTDSVRQGFGGYEEDSETGLDFAQARYYTPTQGRFTSVDPLQASASTSNPQTFNRYAYVNNNPTNAIDPTGMYALEMLSHGGYLYTVGGAPMSHFMELPQQQPQRQRPRQSPQIITNYDTTIYTGPLPMRPLLPLPPPPSAQETYEDEFREGLPPLPANPSGPSVPTLSNSTLQPGEVRSLEVMQSERVITVYDQYGNRLTSDGKRYGVSEEVVDVALTPDVPTKPAKIDSADLSPSGTVRDVHTLRPAKGFTQFTPNMQYVRRQVVRVYDYQTETEYTVGYFLLKTTLTGLEITNCNRGCPK